MSNTTRYDALLVTHLARELNALLSGLRVTALAFDRTDESVYLQTETRTLHWSVAIAGGPRWTAQIAGDPLILPKRCTLGSIEALPDERVLRIELRGGQKANAVHALMLELMPTQSNVIALDDAGRVLKRLLARPGGEQRYPRGQPYQPPAAQERLGIGSPLDLQSWVALLENIAIDERAAVLIRQVAWLGPLNVAAVLGADNLDAAHSRYIELVTAPAAPVLLEQPAGQPYPHSLWQSQAQPFASLLDAFAARDTDVADTHSELERRVKQARKKIERLEAELSGAANEAMLLRARADLLMANAHSIPRGAARIELTDFDGNPQQLELDPAVSAIDNAQAWYVEARKRDRASERLPALIDAARAELQSNETLLQRAAAGEKVELPARPVKTRAQQPVAALPYRRYQTSGGLEVRVGKSSRGNDELTLHHAAPHDIWLHARQVGGAHVVLRWNDAEQTPPQRDLVEAAILAALHSKARHSGTVPVDWTRRKYVRKPRGAPLGQVRVERAHTLFVEPDSAVEERLRPEGSTSE